MPVSQTVVISCAGIGSRLGLGQTKSLIQIAGKPLIEWQLSMLKDVKDVRIVVGYEADDVIKTVLALRRDVIFVYNHDFFHTKTLTSLYLGAQYASELVLALDGDLLIHPDDMRQCLEYDGEFIGISEILSDEPVKVNLDQDTRVSAFSRTIGQYEWIGPACLRRDRLVNNPALHVYQVIEPYLPLDSLLVRAMDIDTVNDYSVAQQKIQEWF